MIIFILREIFQWNSHLFIQPSVSEHQRAKLIVVLQRNTFVCVFFRGDASERRVAIQGTASSTRKNRIKYKFCLRLWQKNGSDQGSDNICNIMKESERSRLCFLNSGSKNRDGEKKKETGERSRFLSPACVAVWKPSNSLTFLTNTATLSHSVCAMIFWHSLTLQHSISISLYCNCFFFVPFHQSIDRSIRAKKYWCRSCHQRMASFNSHLSYFFNSFFSFSLLFAIEKIVEILTFLL